MQTNTSPEKNSNKKARRKRSKLKIAFTILLLLIILAAAFCALILWKPSDYESPKVKESKEVSKYLTHIISQDIYNGAQRGEPFELVMIEQGINDIITRSDWPRQAEMVTIGVPEAIFEPNNIILRGLVNYEALDVLVSVEGNAYINEWGLLHLLVSKVKIGAVNITFFARLVAQKAYSSYLETHEVDPNDWEEKLKKAVIYNEPFDPVFEVDGYKIRMENVKIETGKITIDFAPAD